MDLVATTEPLLFAARDDAGTVWRTVLYLLPRDTEDPPATIGLADAWAGTGCFVFLADALGTGLDAAFAAAGWTFLADPRAVGVRFVWAQPFDATAPLAGLWLGVYQPAGGQQPLTSHLFDATLSSLDVLVPANSVVAVAGEGFAFTPPAGQAVQLTASWGGAEVGAVTGPLTVPLTGPAAGTLRFPIAVAEADQTALDIGLRWYFADPQAAATTVGEQFFVSSYRYPVLAQEVTLYAQLHPLAPLDGTRSFFAFTAADAGQSGPPPSPLTSCFRSTLGDPFTLEPATGSASFGSLVLAPHPRASAPSAGDPVTVVPRGDFTLATSRSSDVQLMCGLSGVEYVDLPTGSGAVVTFHPGQPAYASGFVPGAAPVDGPLPQVAPTTSHASIAGGAALAYFAQPDASVLYNHPAPGSGDDPPATVLQPVPVHAATLPTAPPDPTTFPLLPYAGVGGDAPVAAIGQLESQVVSPARRLALRALPPTVAPTLAATASATSTTPQGLLVSGVGQVVWDRVVLARSPGGDQQLALTAVDGDLLAAFQSNKLFLVASDPKALEANLQPADAQILMGLDPTEQWQFDLGTDGWAQHGTIFLLKFYDQAILDLARQTSMWASPGTFNTSPADTCTQLQAILDAVDPDDPDFAALYAAISDPSWNGILAFNVVAPLDELPAQLAGLAVGIDRSKFCAHHVGIAASKIVATPGTDIGITDSSMFGLIHYVGPDVLPGGQLLYQFAVKQLVVLFADSDVAAFSCTIALQVNQLFDEPATLAGATDNVVVLHGSLDKHVANGAVQESYTFQTPSGIPSDFSMTSQVLTAVQLSRGQFATVTTASSATLTEARFVFWGLLDCTALKGFDALSFGREPGAGAPAGLSFGNLVISMSFDPTADPPVPTFEFDASQLSFDLAGSHARANSFAEHFPLTLAAVTQAKTGTTPTTLNYLGVQTPLDQTAVAYPWYSLDFDLDLGSAGALAAQAGFVATFTVAWSPGGTSPRVFTGLKLPGANASKRAVSIEGLFEITFKSLQIIALDDDVYVLVLYGIAFTFLSLSIPSTGQIDFTLFGDPRAAHGGSSLGWYAAYAKPNAAVPATTS